MEADVEVGMDMRNRTRRDKEGSKGSEGKKDERVNIKIHDELDSRPRPPRYKTKSAPNAS